MAIAVKDATETWRDGRFRWAAALLFLLLVAAMAGGAQHQSQIARQHADAQLAERDAWLDKGDMNPHAAAHYGAFVFKPVQPLSAIDPGLDPFSACSCFSKRTSSNWRGTGPSKTRRRRAVSGC